MKFLAFILTAAVSIAPAFADDSSPVGLWKNIDDATGKPKALIRITESNGALQGKIEQLFREPLRGDIAVRLEVARGVGLRAQIMIRAAEVRQVVAVRHAVIEALDLGVLDALVKSDLGQ